MTDETESLFEMMLCADRFCSEIENAAEDLAGQEREDLRLKTVQCRTLVKRIQNCYDNDSLSLENQSASSDFRQLIMAMMWVAYRARTRIAFRTFRKLVMVESGFTHLLLTREMRGE
jgi:hypothetical protein